MNAAHDAKMQGLLNGIAAETAAVCKSQNQGKDHASIIIVLDGERLYWASSLPYEHVLIAVETVANQVRNLKGRERSIVLPDGAREAAH